MRLEAIRALGGFSGGMGGALGPLPALAVSSKEAEALRLAAIETLAQISTSSDPLPGIDGAQEALVSYAERLLRREETQREPVSQTEQQKVIADDLESHMGRNACTQHGFLT